MRQRTKRGYQILLLLSMMLICIITACFCRVELYKAKAVGLTDLYDFENNSVLVTMDESIGGVNKKFTKNFFGDLDVVGIEDLTKVSNENIGIIGTENFHQILKLELKNQSKEHVLQVVEEIGKLDGVEAVTPNYIGEFCAIANDPNYVSQWGISGPNGINIEAAWDINTGSDSVRVGVIDTGISQHEDLIGNLGTGWNFVENNSNTDDTEGHGTHVAGIIGAVGDNQIGISGICKDITLIPLKIANGRSWATSTIIEAISYASEQWGTQDQIDILNFSGWNSPNNSNLYNAINNFPGLFVGTAGNGSQDSSGESHGFNIDVTPNYPGSFDCDNIITVGSLTSDGERSEFSNFGVNSVDIYAPGSFILSTLPNNRYGNMSGTSMAAPHVAGVAALLLSENPTLLSSQIKDIILNSADDITINVPGGTQNVKKLNAASALGKLELIGLFGGGTGASYDPFLIKNATQFRNISKAIQVRYISSGASVVEIPYHFRLESNITLSGDWTPIQTSFAGTLDGNNHYLTYTMNVTQSDLSRDNLGLFELITIGGSVTNLVLRDCMITSDINTELTGNGFTSIGILAGSVDHASYLRNVKVTNPKIECNIKDMSSTGGLAGGIFWTSVSNCQVTGGSITCYTGALGGMAGYGDLEYFNGGVCRTTLTKRNYQDSDKVGPVVGDTESSGSVNTSGITINKEKPCVAKGTLVTLADGSRVPVEQLTGNEMLLVWNLQTGTFDAAPILFIDSDSAATYEIINLSFSDGTTVKTIYEHGFWNCDLDEYVYLRSDADKYIGDWFLRQTTDENGSPVSEKVQLIDVSVTQEYTVAYSPVTYGHLCYYVNGMLSMPGGIEGLFNIFEVDAETMKYDEVQMQADIAQYGLFSYEEFAALFPVSEEVFEAFNGQYLKVAMGKGLIDAEGLHALIERYAEFLSVIE